MKNPFRLIALCALAISVLPASAGYAQPKPAQPIDQPAEFASVRAAFENMTPEQMAAAGYQIVGDCVSSPFGGMGFHAMNFALYGQQFNSGVPDPQKPPILLVDGSGKVVGLEWEANKNAKPEPVLFGQKVPLLPGHPGLEDDHYMLHAYFKPDGKVLFDSFDPELTCPAGAVPAGMPSTGLPFGLPLLLLLAAGVALTALGGKVRTRAQS